MTEHTAAPTTEQTPQRLAGRFLATKQGSARLKTAVTLAASTLSFPDGQINVLDAQEQHTISDPHRDPYSIPRQHSICQYVVDGAAPLVLDDVRTDARLATVPAVARGQVGSYLGLPLATTGRSVDGTLCVMDARTRTITPGDVNRLGHFVDVVRENLELMRVREQREVDALAAAIGNGEIAAWYEPIVDLHTGAVAGYEAKGRWRDPSGSVVDPSTLVPAGDVDLALQLERAVLRRAFADAATSRRNAPNLRVSINISNRHLDTPDGVREICFAAIDAGVPPVAIDLELVETEDFVDEQQARNAIGALRQYGFGVVLDDFGSGWSSLEWVLRLPVSGIKLNRAATVALGTPIGDSLARALAGLAAQCRIDASVDGLTALEQVDLVQRLGYRHGQGAFWAPAAPAAPAASGLVA